MSEGVESPDKEVGAKQPAFARDNRYIVLKRSDLAYAMQHGLICMEDATHLGAIVKALQESRRLQGKPRRGCVVVQDNWEIYEQVWALVELESRRRRCRRA